MNKMIRLYIFSYFPLLLLHSFQIISEWHLPKGGMDSGNNFAAALSMLLGYIAQILIIMLGTLIIYLKIRNARILSLSLIVILISGLLPWVISIIFNLLMHSSSYTIGVTHFVTLTFSTIIELAIITLLVNKKRLKREDSSDK